MKTIFSSSYFGHPALHASLFATMVRSANPVTNNMPEEMLPTPATIKIGDRVRSYADLESLDVQTGRRPRVPVLVSESTATLPTKAFSHQSGNRSGTGDPGEALQARFCPPE
jgi:hypothetical protein